MNLNKKKKAVYKSALAILLSGTMMAGCSKNEEPVQDTDPEVTDPEEAKEPEEVEDYLPTEVMTPEETNALTAGQYIEAADLTKLPNAAELEKRDLSVMYFYARSITPVDTS